MFVFICKVYVSDGPLELVCRSIILLEDFASHSLSATRAVR